MSRMYFCVFQLMQSLVIFSPHRRRDSGDSVPLTAKTMRTACFAPKRRSRRATLLAHVSPRMHSVGSVEEKKKFFFHARDADVRPSVCRSARLSLMHLLVFRRRNTCISLPAEGLRSAAKWNRTDVATGSAVDDSIALHAHPCA